MLINEAKELSNLFNKLPDSRKLCRKHKLVLTAGIGACITGVSQAEALVFLACPDCERPFEITSINKAQAIMYLTTIGCSNSYVAQDFRRKIRRKNR